MHAVRATLRGPFDPRQPFLPVRCLKVFVTEIKLLPRGECYRNQVIASQWVLPRSRR